MVDIAAFEEETGTGVVVCPTQPRPCITEMSVTTLVALVLAISSGLWLVILAVL